jgi:hypothetical protein
MADPPSRGAPSAESGLAKPLARERATRLENAQTSRNHGMRILVKVKLDKVDKAPDAATFLRGFLLIESRAADRWLWCFASEA